MSDGQRLPGAHGPRVIWNVQVMRFVAAFMVLWSHLVHETPEVPGLAMQGYEPWMPVYLAGGVDVFFVISGFIMFTLSGNAFGKPGAAQAFLLKRCLRVVPLYWIFTAAMVLAMVVLPDQVAHSSLSAEHLAASFLFLPWPSPYGATYPVLMLGWTLNFEMAFYLVFGIALLVRRAAGVALLYGVISFAALVGTVQPPSFAPMAFWCNPIVLEFLLGVALGVLYTRGVRVTASSGWWMIAGGILTMASLHAAGFTENHWAYRWLWMGLPALLVVTGAALMPNEPRPGAVLSALVLLGNASYVLYLSHPFTLALVKLGWAYTGLQHPTTYLLIAGTVCVVVAVLLHLLLERPLMRALSNAVERRRPSVFTAGPPNASV